MDENPFNKQQLEAIYWFLDEKNPDYEFQVNDIINHFNAFNSYQEAAKYYMVSAESLETDYDDDFRVIELSDKTIIVCYGQPWEQ